ncbi:MAG: hypothetical protein RLZZ533_332 [Cyanobacteriota bacterium]|jgi:hypothetical protein
MVTRRFSLFIGLPAACLCTALASTQAARAQYNNNSNFSVQEQRIYDVGPGGTNPASKGGSILDSTNPMDLLNKLKRGTALDDATNPTDAIDAALKELNAQTPPAATPKPGSATGPLVKQP